MPDGSPDAELDDTVEYALQCVLSAQQDLAQLAAGDQAALHSLRTALDHATAKLYDATRGHATP